MLFTFLKVYCYTTSKMYTQTLNSLLKYYHEKCLIRIFRGKQPKQRLLNFSDNRSTLLLCTTTLTSSINIFLLQDALLIRLTVDSTRLIILFIFAYDVSETMWYTETQNKTSNGL